MTGWEIFPWFIMGVVALALIAAVVLLAFIWWRHRSALRKFKADFNRVSGKAS